jgi:hypothetical protein
MPNLATTRAIVWRRLAALRRRLTPERRAPLPPEPPPGAAAPAAGRIPAPLLIDYLGRDGSTALLRLLSTSAGVHVEGRYPYEDDSLQRALAAPDPVAAWSRHSAAPFAAAGPAPRWYAEKAIDVRRLEPAPFADARVIALLRDPRDTWVSIEAFSRAVGSAEIGGSGPRPERLDRFVERQRERLGWIAALADEEARVVRYDDLVNEPATVAAELSGWLGVDLDAAGLHGDFRLRWVHATSRDPARSVGRWRSELADADLAAIRAGLEAPMATLGFADWAR